MKYLGIHKLLWILILLSFLIVEIVFAGVSYILYVIWNFHLPRINWWYNLHHYESDWDGSWIEDYNPWQTLVRRYKKSLIIIRVMTLQEETQKKTDDED